MPVLTTTIDNLNVQNYGTVINLGTLTYNGTHFVDAEGHTIKPYNNFSLSPNPLNNLVTGGQYNVKGVFIVYWSATGADQQIAPRNADDFEPVSTPQPTVATPVINPASGQYANPVDVTITCATEGAMIYYTLDGSDPTFGNFVYTEPFQISTDCTVKARAMKADYQDSEIASATYTFVTPTAVTFSKVVNPIDIDTTANYLLVCESAGTAATGTIISNALQTDSIMVNFANYTVSTAVNIATYPYSIRLEAAEGGYHIAINNGYLNNQSSTSLAIGSTANSVWVINPYGDGFILQNRSNKYRFIGGTSYNGTSYKAYDTTNLGKPMYPLVYLYKEGEVAPPMAHVETPVLSPEGGTYANSVVVTATCATEGATIHYTLDGENPTSASPVFPSAGITLTETTTVKAMATAEGMVNSDVVEATYTIQQLTSINTIAGIWELANTVGDSATSAVVTFNDWYVTAVKGGQAFISDGQYGFVIYQSGHGFKAGDKLNGSVICEVLLYQNYYAELLGVQASDLTVVANQEMPVLTTTIDNLVVQNYGTVINLGTLTYNGTHFEDAEGHTITPYNNFSVHPNPVSSLVTGGEYNVKGISIIFWSATGADQQIAPRNADDFELLGIPQQTVATPVISPESGQYPISVEVTITCATEGATIYYTLDGSDPVVAGSVYTEPFRITTDCTVKALASKVDWEDSEIVSATYTIFTPTVVTFSKVVNPIDIDTTANYLLVCESAGTAATGTIISNALQTDSIMVNFANYTVSTVTNLDSYPYSIRLEAAEGGYHIAINNGYLNNPSSTSLAIGSTASSVWELNPYEGGFIFQNKNNKRFIGGMNDSGKAYKAYAASNLGSYPAVYLYKEGEVAPLPTNTQVADLSTGWSWFSSYIMYDDNTLSDIQNQIDNLNVTGLIKSQNAFVSNQGGFWAGSLNELDNRQMYMINLDQPISLTLSGAVVNPQDHPITLNTGWNWVSFLASQEMSLSDVVGQLTPTDGDVFKGQNAFASYSATMNSWVGSLTTLVPGQGYMFLNYGEQMTMTYPVAGKSMVTMGEENRYWSNDSHRYADNLTMMVTLDPSVMTLSDGSHEVGAFVNGECRGSARIHYLEGLGTYVAFLTVSGQEGEEIHFNVYDVENDIVIETQALERLTFVSDGVFGSLEQPYVLHFAMNCLGEHENTVSVFPNPAKGKFYVQGEDLRSVTVYNTLGQAVLHNEYGQAKQVELSLSHLGAGVYTIVVNTAYGTHTAKLVVTE